MYNRFNVATEVDLVRADEVQVTSHCQCLAGLARTVFSLKAEKSQQAWAFDAAVDAEA